MCDRRRVPHETQRLNPCSIRILRINWTKSLKSERLESSHENENEDQHHTQHGAGIDSANSERSETHGHTPAVFRGIRSGHHEARHR